MGEASLVFQGTVTDVERLPKHPEMRGRDRFAVKFVVDRYWKGTPGATVTLYDVDPGTDCMGFGFELGKSYLVYASLNKAHDIRLDKDYFWFGWTDVLAPGSEMFQFLACTQSGLISDQRVRAALRKLGRGKAVP